MSVSSFSGCGHGRYLHINKTVFKVGSDVCAPLVSIAASKCDDDVMVCDNLQLPYRSASRIAFKLMLSLKDVELKFVCFRSDRLVLTLLCLWAFSITLVRHNVAWRRCRSLRGLWFRVGSCSCVCGRSNRRSERLVVKKFCEQTDQPTKLICENPFASNDGIDFRSFL